MTDSTPPATTRGGRVFSPPLRSPPTYYVTRDGAVHTVTLAYVTVEELEALTRGDARILRRRDRRRALRKLGRPWPVCGGAPARHPYPNGGK